MKSYTQLMKQARLDFEIRIRKINSIKHMIPIAEEYSKKTKCSYIFPDIDDDGINLNIEPMTVKEILIHLDDEFWSKGIETKDPIKSAGEITIQCYEKPGLYLRFILKEGDGCYKVQTGVQEVPTYTWKCK